MAFFMRKILWLCCLGLLLAGCGHEQKQPAVPASAFGAALHQTIKSVLDSSKVSIDIPAQINDSMALAAKNKQWPVWMQNGLALGEYFARNDSIDNAPVIAEMIFDSLIAKEKLLPDDTAFNESLCKVYAFKSSYCYDKGDFENMVLVLDKCIANPFFYLLSDGFKLYVLPKCAEALTRLGENQKALQYFNQSLLLIGKDPQATEQIVQIKWQISNTLNNMQQYDTAINTLLPLISEKKISAKTKTAVLGVLAQAFQYKGDLNEAGKYANMALTVLNGTPADSKDRDMEAQLITVSGDVKKYNNQFAAAIALYNTAINRYKAAGKETGREVAKILIDQGYCYEKLNNADSAMFRYQLSLQYTTGCAADKNPSQSQVYAENAIVDALEHKADILVSSGNMQKSAATAAEVVDIYSIALTGIQKLLSSYSFDQSKIATLQQSKLITSKAINQCYRLFMQSGNKSWAEKAFSLSENCKANVLLQSVKKNAAFATAGDTLFKKLKSFQKQIAVLETALFDIQQWGDKNNPDIIRRLSTQKDSLQNLQIQTETRLINSNPIYQSLLRKENTVSLERMNDQLLQKNTVLLEYFSCDSTQFVFLKEKDIPVKMVKINKGATLLIDTFFSFLTNKEAILNNPLGYGKIANNLFQLLQLNKINIHTSNLIIIPDEKICLVPFDALLTTPTGSLNIRQWPFAIKKFVINYGYSIATLMEQMGDHNNDINTALAAYAPFNLQGKRKLSRLSNTEGELKEIQQQFKNGYFYCDSAATLTNFRNSISNAAIIHIASHAFADEGNQMQCGIEFFDSTLYLNELYAMKLNANLVVLSSCESGIGKIEKTEGAMSLARGFYYAGAKNVITSLWEVNDKSTGQLFNIFYKEKYYEQYAAGLQKAKLVYLENAGVENASPYYWASFIPIGYQVKPTATYSYWWLLVLFPIAGVFYFYKRL